jgi:hypothetical protein
MCYLIQACWIYYIPLPIYNSDCSNVTWKSKIFHLRLFVKGGALQDRPLKQCFPTLFSIVRNKDAIVLYNLAVHNDVIQ